MKNDTGKLKLFLFNVGQGDHMLIELPNGEFGIIDFYYQTNMNQNCVPALVYLKKLKEESHGSPIVHTDDVPNELKNINEDDDLFHKRWDYVLDEMIYAFEHKASYKCDTELSSEEEERMDNGFRLFGKYYRGLWD